MSGMAAPTASRHATALHADTRPAEANSAALRLPERQLVVNCRSELAGSRAQLG
jgi:hypothetical protein